MLKIKGRHYKRVAKNKDGTCPNGTKRHRRSGNKKESCYRPMAAPKARKKRKK